LPHKIFISYRRGDSASAAGHLFDLLGQRFGDANVFLDVQQIAPGVNFIKALEREIDRSDVLVLIIGPHWLSGSETSTKNRLLDPEDFVRKEIGRAMASSVPIVPVLVGGGHLPAAEEVPEVLRGILSAPPVTLRAATFEADAAALGGQLRRMPQRGGNERSWGKATGLLAKNLLISLFILIAFGIALIVLSVLIYAFFQSTAGGPLPDPRKRALFFGLCAFTLGLLTLLLLTKRLDSPLIFTTLALCCLICIDIIVSLSGIARDVPVLVATGVVGLTFIFAYVFIRNRRRVRAVAERERRLVTEPVVLPRDSRKVSLRIGLTAIERDAETWAGRVSSRLRVKLGIDLDVLPHGGIVGADPRQLASQPDILIVLIGRSFAVAVADPAGSAAAPHAAASAAVIANALANGAHVVPVLINGAVMPSPKDLTPSLEGIALRHACQLSHAGFTTEMERVATVVRERQQVIRDMRIGFGSEKRGLDKFLESEIAGLTRAASYSFIALGFFLVAQSIFETLSEDYYYKRFAIGTWTPFHWTLYFIMLAIVVALACGGGAFLYRRRSEKSWMVFLAIITISVMGGDLLIMLAGAANRDRSAEENLLLWYLMRGSLGIAVIAMMINFLLILGLGLYRTWRFFTQPATSSLTAEPAQVPPAVNSERNHLPAQAATHK